MSRKDDEQLQQRIRERLDRQPPGKPLALRKLVRELGLPKHADRRLRRLLKDLVQQGQVIAEGQGRYSRPPPGGEIEGVLGRPGRDGVFLLGAEDEAQLVIAFDALGGALPGDVVLAEPTRKRRSGPDLGRVVTIVERGRQPIVGLLRKQAKSTVLVPDDDRLGGPVLISDEGGPGARDGQVVAAVVESADPGDQPRGRLVQLLGEPGSLATERERLVLEFGLQRGFPAAVEREQAGVADDPAAAPAPGRADLRHLPLFTIDPADAKDFDDAVLVEPAGEGWRLWVAIADVAAAVADDSATDAEAQRRGCSTYLPGEVFPMLPAALSEGRCSLAPGRDREAMCLEMDVDPQGRVRGGRARRALIRSSARLDYDEVQVVIDGGPPGDRVRPVVDRLQTAVACARALLERMRRRGQILFDLPELDIRLDAEGRPAEIRPTAGGLAHRMIEAFMVAANEAVARSLGTSGAPVIYRIHPPPDPERMELFGEVATGLGAPPPFGSEPEPLEVAEYLDAVRDKPAAPALEQMLLRSLMQARYSVENLGHYGLASESYAHFTSPIRRYPDLVVHRLLAAALERAGADGLDLSRPPRPNRWPVGAERAEQMAGAASRAERRAMEAERAADDLYQAAWAHERIGEQFSARVVHTADFGLFARLEPSGVEGLIHVSELGDDYYEHDESQLALVGRSSGHTFRMGQQLEVRIASANLSRRQVDLVPVQ